MNRRLLGSILTLSLTAPASTLLAQAAEPPLAPTPEAAPAEAPVAEPVPTAEAAPPAAAAIAAPVDPAAAPPAPVQPEPVAGEPTPHPEAAAPVLTAEPLAEPPEQAPVAPPAAEPSDEEKPLWFSGSSLGLVQTAWPGSRSTPDSDNAFYGLALDALPMVILHERATLAGRFLLYYEVTTPDSDTGDSRAVPSDTDLTLSITAAEFDHYKLKVTPRAILPTSRESIAANTYLIAGSSLGVVGVYDEVLEGLALTADGRYLHTFAGSDTRELHDGGTAVTIDDPSVVGVDGPVSVGGGGNLPVCRTTGGSDVTCPASSGLYGTDSLRARARAVLGFYPKWELDVLYAYVWGLGKQAAESDVPSTVIANDSASVPLNGDASRWRRSSSLDVAVNYNIAQYLDASLGVSTAVCYNSPSSGQEAAGGCASGLKQHSFFDRNPLLNRYSTVSLTLSVPIDGLYRQLQGQNEVEAKTAAAKKKATSL